MTHGKTLPGLAAGIKQKLIQQALQRKLRNAAPATASPLAAGARVAVGEAHCRFDQHPAPRPISFRAGWSRSADHP